MIQAIGIITDNGITFTDPLFNLNIYSPSKFQPSFINLFIGEIGEGINPDSTKTKYFKSIYDFSTWSFQVKNPSFEELQNLALIQLENLYPLVTFEIV